MRRSGERDTTLDVSETRRGLCGGAVPPLLMIFPIRDGAVPLLLIYLIIDPPDP